VFGQRVQKNLFFSLIVNLLFQTVLFSLIENVNYFLGSQRSEKCIGFYDNRFFLIRSRTSFRADKERFVNMYTRYFP